MVFQQSYRIFPTVMRLFMPCRRQRNRPRKVETRGCGQRFEDGKMMKSERSEFEAACCKAFCPWCGKPMRRNPMGSPRVFCTDRYRWAYNRWKRRKKRGRKLSMNKLEIRTFKIADLKPAKYNPRKKLKPGDKEYEKLKKSIESFAMWS